MTWLHRETRISFHPFLLPLEIFSKPACYFWTWMILTLLPHRRIKGLLNRKVLPRCGRRKTQGHLVTISLSLSFCLCITYVLCFLVFEPSSFMPCIVLTCFCLFVCFLFCFILFFIILKTKKKIEKLEKYKNNVCFVYIGTCVPWMAIETKFSKLCIFCSLDEHLCEQLNKWALWLVFVMTKIKSSLILNTHITLFDRND